VNWLLLNYTSRPGTEEHINLANKKVSQNTKIKSKEIKQAIKTTVLSKT
jgi:hypothetical protein